MSSVDARAVRLTELELRACALFDRPADDGAIEDLERLRAEVASATAGAVRERGEGRPGAEDEERLFRVDLLAVSVDSALAMKRRALALAQGLPAPPAPALAEEAPAPPPPSLDEGALEPPAIDPEKLVLISDAEEQHAGLAATWVSETARVRSRRAQSRFEAARVERLPSFSLLKWTTGFAAVLLFGAIIKASPEPIRLPREHPKPTAEAPGALFTLAGIDARRASGGAGAAGEKAPPTPRTLSAARVEGAVQALRAASSRVAALRRAAQGKPAPVAGSPEAEALLSAAAVVRRARGELMLVASQSEAGGARPLLDLARDLDPDLAAAGAEALVVATEEESDREIVDHLYATPPPEVVPAVVLEAAERRLPPAEAAFARIARAQDAGPVRRAAALRGLASVGGKDVVQDLVRMTDDPALGSEAGSALADVVERLRAEGETRATLAIPTLPPVADAVPARRLAVEAALADEQATQALEAALRSRDPEVRLALADALARFDGESRPSLLARLAQDEDPAVRAAAVIAAHSPVRRAAAERPAAREGAALEADAARAPAPRIQLEVVPPTPSAAGGGS